LGKNQSCGADGKLKLSDPQRAGKFFLLHLPCGAGRKGRVFDWELVYQSNLIRWGFLIEDSGMQDTEHSLLFSGPVGQQSSLAEVVREKPPRFHKKSN